MAEINENETDPPLNARRDLAIRLAMFGAISGVVASVAIIAANSMSKELAAAIGGSGMPRDMPILIAPESIFPGLVFGLIMGFALRRRGLLGSWRYPAYIVAAGLSYFAAVQVGIYIGSISWNIFLASILAGLVGAGLLTAATAKLIPQGWRIRFAIPTTAGATLGLLLIVVTGGPLPVTIAWALLFVPWQAGYAAALAFALDDRRQLTPTGVEASKP